MGTDDNITNGISGSTTTAFAHNITPGTLDVNINGDVTGTVSSLSNHDTDDLNEGSSNFYYTEAKFNNSFSGKHTTDLSEGTNLYYTNSRFDSRLASKTTDDLTEGSNNLYYTDARFDLRLGNKTTDNLTEGSNNLYYTDARFDLRLGNKTTDNLTEGPNNLYYTDAKFNTSFSGKSTTDLSEGTNLYYTDARFDLRLGNKTTDNLSEGTSNLYHTNARARGAISVSQSGGDGSLAYNSTTGVITYAGPSASEVRAHISAGTGVSIASGEISIGQPISSTDNVTFNSVTASLTGNVSSRKFLISQTMILML